MNVELDECMRWAAGLKYEDIPQDVIEAAKNQVASMLAAVLHGYHSREGEMIRRAFGVEDGREQGGVPIGLLSGDQAKAVFLLSSWSMIHDYDDVMLGGHTGHSSVLVPYLLAMARRGTGREVLLAQVVANEVAARFNIACALGETRGQMASYLHLIAASVARAKYEQRDASTMASVLAFALAAPSKLSLPGFLGADTKFFCAAGAIRSGWEAVDCIDAGLRSTQDTVSGAHGFFGALATSTYGALFADLGERWYTMTNSFKAYPSCGYISSSVDAALAIMSTQPIDHDQIHAVEIEASMFTCGVERLTRPYLAGAESSLATLTFSPAFVVASTLVHGEFTPANLTGPRLEDVRVWALAERVRVRHARRHTRSALFTGIPTGVMLSKAPWREAGPFLRKFNRAVFGRENRLISVLRNADLVVQWMTSRRAGLSDFRRITKPMGSTVRVLTRDGATHQATCEIPQGFAGAEGRPVRRMLREKYLAAAAGFGHGEAAARWSLLERLDSASAEDMARYNFISKEMLT